jgi:hypothetical protein
MGSTGIEITRIDNDNPVGTITYSSSVATSGTVQAFISFDKTGVVIINTGFAPCLSGASEVLLGRCTFTGDGDFTFYFKDEVGHLGERTAIVHRIDTTPPSVQSISYSPPPPTLTNGDVQVLIEMMEAIQPPVGWTYLSPTLFTRTFTGNTLT